MTGSVLTKAAYSVTEVAELYSCSESHIRRMVRRGELGVVPHMGARVVIPVAELERVFGAAS